MPRRPLTIKALCDEAAAFAQSESTYPEPSLYGVTDGKAVGTYLEHKFRAHLEAMYKSAPSNSAMGIDFPGDPGGHESYGDHAATVFLPVQVSAAEDLRFGLSFAGLCL